MKTDQFCDLCGVTNDLHDGPESCDYAGRKADAIDEMSRLMFGGFVR